MPFTETTKSMEVIITNKSELTAVESDVLLGKNFIGVNKYPTSGNIPINEERTDITIENGEKCNIPFGYNPQAYNVTAKTTEELTPGTAIKANILKDKTAWVNGVQLTGTMPNNSPESIIVACDEEYKIPRGYHDGTGTVTGLNLKDQTVATATADVILNGYTAWVNGQQLTGYMPHVIDFQKELQAGQSYSISGIYYSGNSSISAASLESQTEATATGNDILTGKTAWVNGQLISGSIPIIPDEVHTLELNTIYTIPEGYHSGNGTVTQNITTKTVDKIYPTTEDQTIETKDCYIQNDIVVNGVDALSYGYESNVMNDNAGTAISDYELTVVENSATVKFESNNWHDNASTNVYKITTTDLIDINDANVTIDCVIYVHNGILRTSTFNGITLNIAFDEENECQYLAMSNIKSGKITVVSIFKARAL